MRVQISPRAPAAVRLRFQAGVPGPVNTLAIGAVSTGAAGSSAVATITGTAPSQTLNLTIPRGTDGTNGTNGTNGLGVPTGGAIFNQLRKKSANDNDTVWAEPAHARANILDFYSGTPTMCSGVSGSGSDMQPAGVAALTALTARYGRGELFIPPGNWRIATGFGSANIKGHSIVGAGSQASILSYDNTTGAALAWDGAGNFTGGGAKGLTVQLLTGGTTGTATGILLQGDQNLQPNQLAFEDVFINAAGGNYWYNGFFAYGRGKRSGAQGIRVFTVKQMQVFSCRGLGIYLDNCEQPVLEAIGTYVPWAPASTVTITLGSPATINWTGHGLPVDTAVVFSSTGTLPTGITSGTTYYVSSNAYTANSFQCVTAPSGSTFMNATAAGSGTYTCSVQGTGANIQFNGGTLDGTYGGACTISIASPAVVTDAGSALANGTAVIFTTTGALPTGITAGAVYYVANATTNTYTLVNGSGVVVNTSGTQSGTHTVTRTMSERNHYVTATGIVCNGTLSISNTSAFVLMGSTADFTWGSGHTKGFTAVAVSGTTNGVADASVKNFNF